jgi:Tol biopolymer transport system component
VARRRGDKNHLPDLQAIDWDLSPDGASVAILSRGGNDNHILLLRDNGAFGEFIASNTSSLRSLNWWANGEGFFCSRESRNTISMLSISRDRKITVLDKDLGDGPSWAVPSPDGHRLAFVSHMKHYNVWLAARRP